MPVQTWIKKHGPPGDLQEVIVDWKGPSSYTVVTPGASPSGGDTLPLGLFGCRQILMVEATGAKSANFTVVPMLLSSGTWTLFWLSLYTGTVGGQSQVFGTQAITTSDLSAEYVRLKVIVQ